MKIIFLVIFALFFVVTPVYGQALSDATGLVNRLEIETSGHNFEVETVANFDISTFEFDKDEKRLTLHIVSGLENNLGEIIIPKNLLGGNLTLYLNEQEYLPKIKSNDKISFISLNFSGSGENKLDIVGTTYLLGLTEKSEKALPPPDLSPSSDEDYGLIYLIILVIILIIAGVIALLIKRQRKL